MSALTIIDFLEQDHQEAKDLLKNLEETSAGTIKARKDLFPKLKQELMLHQTIEETILYPALKECVETNDLVLEAYEEHHVVEIILEELEKLEPNEENWIAKLTVLKENLEHHIEEEEKELFPYAKKLLAKEILIKMGEEMQALKQKTE